MTFAQKKIRRVWYQLKGLFCETKKLVIHLWFERIYKPGDRLTVSLGAGICKGLADHFNKRSFIYPNIFATTTLYLLIRACKGIFFDNSCLMTTQNLPLADLVIFPKFIFTRSTTDNQHIISRQSLMFLLVFHFCLISLGVDAHSY
jgi:hypothetical protein